MDVETVIENVIEEWGQERPELDMSPMRTLHPIWLVVEALVRVRSSVIKEFGLTLASLDVLAALRRRGKPYRSTPTNLAQVAMVTTGGMTSRLDRLEKAGHIRRVPDARDRRVQYAELTDRGLKLIDEVIQAFAEREVDIVSQLSAAEQKRLQKLTHQLLHAISDD